MSITGISPHEANMRLNSGQDIVAQGHQALQRVQDVALTMVGSSFRGQSANALGQKVQQTFDECKPILHAMERALETGKQHAATFANFDQEV
ncbi:MAG: hypothetical protein J2P17_06515 [Mycobacterium sp.]|nr:hypothetical protein [Mycobacterium sp.]